MQILEDDCPPCSRCFPTPIHQIQMNDAGQTRVSLDNKLVIHSFEPGVLKRGNIQNMLGIRSLGPGLISSHHLREHCYRAYNSSIFRLDLLPWYSSHTHVATFSVRWGLDQQLFLHPPRQCSDPLPEAWEPEVPVQDLSCSQYPSALITIGTAAASHFFELFFSPWYFSSF